MESATLVSSPTLLNLLLTEVGVALVLIVPFGDGAKQAVVSFFERQKWIGLMRYPLFSLVTLLSYLLVDVSLDARRTANVINAQGGFTASHEARLLRAQRDQYVAAFALLMLLVIYRLYALVRRATLLTKSLEAMTKQAQGAAAAALATASAPDAGSKAASAASAEDRIAAAERRALVADSRLAALQAENARLRTQVQDYDTMFAGSRKKAE